ncbi:response regulator transcription factor [Lederbergia galactosidilytica]|uniref:Response regulator n=1 Tax=Lederbergia galactosidilytica TaxID=217031 RepID=A0A177ZTL1_9BACI|nr:response regulator [Lederbergia galactosidilytica]KRG13216.1 hypothetical protein ACA30_16625 [Virgibacillus soli]OAK71242.1 hypothetical protein ABB05_10875 [Lederbergia galactosidilytica]
MIKVLIVEDDKLVRRSLIQSFNWEKFDMKVVGDAKNGQKALEFLEGTKVDLIITDLAMPIMSGIDLIRQVKNQYYNIFIVVLSLHRDFEYIQEAMRLGAIDYIAKVELDNKNMDQTLERIQKRIKKEVRNTALSIFQSSNELEQGFLLLAEKSLENTIVPFYDQRVRGQDILYFSLEALLIKTRNRQHHQEIKESLFNLPKWPISLLILELYEGTYHYTFDELKNLVLQHKDSLLFYELSNKQKVKIIELNDLKVPDIQSEKGIAKIKDRLVSLDWIIDNHTLQGILSELKVLRLSKSKINELLFLTVNKCNRVYSDVFPVDLELPPIFEYWTDVEKWFNHTKEWIHFHVFSQSFTSETNQSVLKAISIIEHELNKALTANDVARKVNMSRSYFSVCFKAISGYTFNEYLRIARVNKAKHYLINTRDKVRVISEKVGYVDIKYFSKVFRQETGLLPSEYRKMNKV